MKAHREPKEDLGHALKVMRSMKHRACSYGLWREVRGEYLHNRTHGHGVSASAWHATYEWDL